MYNNPILHESILYDSYWYLSKQDIFDIFFSFRQNKTERI